MADEPKVDERGFEWQGEFYPWTVTDKGKDLILIDRIAGMLPHEFFRIVDDGGDPDRLRGPVILALVATSLRGKHPTWSIERVMQIVGELSLGDLEWIGPAEEEEEGPPEPEAELEETPSSSVEEEALPESSATSNGSPESPSEKLSESQA